MKNKITRKGRHIYLNGKRVITLHVSKNHLNKGFWTYSLISTNFNLSEGYASFRLAVKAAKEHIEIGAR